MLYKNIYISNPASLKIKNKQILISNHDGEHTIPISEIGTIVLDHKQIMLSVSFVAECAENGVVCFVVDDYHLPKSIILPFATHSRNAEVVDFQINMTAPLKKQIWKIVVRQKIENQAHVASGTKEYTSLLAMAKAVSSGDGKNMEAQAASRYFPAIFGKSFSRRDDSDIRNAMLNYGYSIIRGCVARSIVAHGLLPQIGIFHSNGLNQFNLADDLIEPFRPIIDTKVIEITMEYKKLSDLALYPKEKAILLSVLQDYCILRGQKYEIQKAIDASVASIKSAIVKNDSTLIVLPSLLSL